MTTAEKRNVEMRPIAVLVSVLTLIASLVAVAWFGQPPAPIADAPKPRAAADKPQPRETGPHPKCVVIDPIYDFGSMPHRAKGSHKFVVKNEGTVPLKLQTGQTTCQCTIGKLGDDTVPPGGETTIELNWEIKLRKPNFQHQAMIHTDDPEKLQFELTVKGFVTLDLLHVPNDLSFGTMSEDRPSEGSIFLASMNVPDFTIPKVESSSEDVTTTVSEVKPDGNPDFFRMMMGQADFPIDRAEEFPKLVKKIYRVDVVAKGQKRQGAFRESVTIHTDVPNAEPISVTLTGENPGAFQFFPQGGARWHSRALILDLGEFSGEMGRKRGLNVIGRGITDPLNFVVESVTPEIAKVTVTPNAANKMACMLEVEVPPGTPTLIKTPDDPVTIVLKSNHPQVEKLEIKVIFSVQ